MDKNRFDPAGSLRFSPGRKGFLELSPKYRLLSVSCSLPADTVTPIGLFQKFDDGDRAFLLESVVGGERWGRYSIMGRKPLIRIFARKKEVYWEIGQTGMNHKHDSPLPLLRRLLQEYALPPASRELPFCCGLVGYFAYDFIRYVERLPDTNPDELDLPDCDLMAPAEVMLFDHLNNELTLVCNLIAGSCPDKDYDYALHVLQTLAAEMKRPIPADPEENLVDIDIAISPGDLSARHNYMESVRQAQDYIRRGDIFQVVLSRRFSIPCQLPPLSVYRALRRVNPSPYLFFLRSQRAILIGSSPEMLVRLTGGRLETCPIAGTRRRGGNADEDEALALELLADEKESAEHAMLVDLARNDIGRISAVGSVKVKSFRQVEKYSHVMHLVSQVEGRLRPGFTPVDVLASLLPAGTLSGAPKIRAMEIIDELEAARRGPYGGAVGYLGFDGNLDTCITIRTAVLQDGRVHIQAGAGIVADSQAASEHAEVISKAQAMFSALSRAGDYR